MQSALLSFSLVLKLSRKWLSLMRFFLLFLPFFLSQTDLITPPILQFQDVGFRYSSDQPYLFKDLNIGIDMESRVALIGQNGSGKQSSLHHLLSPLFCLLSVLPASLLSLLSLL